MSDALRPCRQLALLLTLHVIALPVVAQTLPVLGCLLEPTTTTELSASSRGKVAQINVKRGDLVSKGDVLARLESGVEELNVKLATTRAKMRMDLQSKEARLALSLIHI